MAGDDEVSASISLNSHDTALCVILPAQHSERIDQLRSLYDKAWGRWPPHVNIIYPFVNPELLHQAKDRIQTKLSKIPDLTNLQVHLGKVGTFSHRDNHTISLQERDDVELSSLELLRTVALEALGRSATPYTFHLTIGQSEDKSESSRNFLADKAQLLPKVDFVVPELAILIRERAPTQPMAQSCMRLWGTIPLRKGLGLPMLPEFWLSSGGERVSNGDLVQSHYVDRIVRCATTYQYNHALSKWSPYERERPLPVSPPHLRISSYNVLIDSVHPPDQDRFPLLLKNLLSKVAMADILVLQEVSDHFLSYLLSEPQVARLSQVYTYCTHAPPSQSDIDSLPSLRNVAILSRFPFKWTIVPFSRRHKAAAIARFQMRDSSEPSKIQTYAVAGIHLTCGLTDGSVAAKKTQLQNLMTYLEQNHPKDSWIIAGDFNLTTSTHTIDKALSDMSITQQTASTLSGIETRLRNAGFLDAWSVARLSALESTYEAAVELYDGEQGATFNPMENQLAAAISGTSRNRPQRYDRILMRSQGMLHIVAFNDFGRPEVVNGHQVVASEHSGVRAIFATASQAQERPSISSLGLGDRLLEQEHASSGLVDLAALEEALSAHNMIPSEEERQGRKAAFALLETILQGKVAPGPENAITVPFVVVPVGSYALDVWDAGSDIDCLCIGRISSKTFFQLARQRIRRVAPHVRLIRRVDANSGTMLELTVNGINVDLQYCPAAQIVERWSDVPTLDRSDPIFNLSMLSLRKLKPFRDITFIKRSLPSLHAFQLAYRCIKLWAVQHGIYSSKFGYLGGIHITLMLARVCKYLTQDASTVTLPDILATFFHHYANFDWKNEIVYDGFFHQKVPRYQRSAKEPMVVLGYHSPNSNVAHTSTGAGLSIIGEELHEAYQRLTQDGMTWTQFFGPSESGNVFVPRFLTSHDSFAKIDLQYWGKSLAKGKGLVGWIESRCLLLLVEISKAILGYKIQIWPARFRHRDSASELSAEFEVCYLIGLSRPTGPEFSLSGEEKESARSTLENIIVRFVSQLRRDEKNYDESTSCVAVSLVKPSEVADLVLDSRDWGDYDTEEDLDSDSDDDLDDDTEENAQSATTLPYQPHNAKSVPNNIPKSKLRPASDVLSRLRWDPSLDPSDYIVGYEDRFLGPKEMPLDRWKSDVSEDEFIPMHRVLWFRRKGNGEVVWDRRARNDKVFGRGVGWDVKEADA
ncbi:hypothetical protein M011DRAFT_294760 [Sporormia fimetaria CBS 119925]|uniref:polynucleotide adenylyltransferase n=1 Tax=Sporormia fimetaria CBS 119925 TaxID=1340428 RepID=A0A6A6UX75_9PLEO|nr:hypothetical protein M011DRAFT_294760 [Sporormia fimetaria CBS 119925]